MNPIVIALILTIVALLVAILALNFRLKQRESAFKSFLESNQKRLDNQTSKLNILMRAIPHIQGIVFNTNNLESWKSICLDELRSIVRADGGSFWLFSDTDQHMELSLARGSESYMQGTVPPVSLDDPEIGKAAKTRAPVLTGTNEEKDNCRILSVPFSVEGNLYGVFRFTRFEDEPFQTKDIDLISMFLKQIGLAIENKNMAINREKFYLELVQALADSLDTRDASGHGLTREVRSLARAMGRALDMPEEFIYYLELASLMHDIGNLSIDESLLKKPGKLTPQEFEIIKKHPEYGYKILAPVSMLAPVASMVLYHQEWFNGKGYPEGLSGEEIPLGARIVAVLDAWGSMLSPKPWRGSLSREQAIAEIRKGSGTQFDPRVVDSFTVAIEKLGMTVDSAT